MWLLVLLLLLPLPLFMHASCTMYVYNEHTHTVCIPAACETREMPFKIKKNKHTEIGNRFHVQFFFLLLLRLLHLATYCPCSWWVVYLEPLNEQRTIAIATADIEPILYALYIKHTHAKHAQFNNLVSLNSNICKWNIL